MQRHKFFSLAIGLLMLASCQPIPAQTTYTPHYHLPLMTPHTQAIAGSKTDTTGNVYVNGDFLRIDNAIYGVRTDLTAVVSSLGDVSDLMHKSLVETVTGVHTFDQKTKMSDILFSSPHFSVSSPRFIVKTPNGDSSWFVGMNNGHACIEFSSPIVIPAHNGSLAGKRGELRMGIDTLVYRTGSQDIPIVGYGASVNDALSWNGSAWVPQPISVIGGGGGAIDTHAVHKSGTEYIGGTKTVLNQMTFNTGLVSNGGMVISGGNGLALQQNGYIEFDNVDGVTPYYIKNSSSNSARGDFGIYYNVGISQLEGGFTTARQLFIKDSDGVNTGTFNMQKLTADRIFSLPNASGTFAISASTPLNLNSTTGALTFLNPGSEGDVLKVVSGVWTSAAPSSGGVTTIGTIDSQTPAANGAVISGANIYMQSASATVPGLVNTTTQSLAGVKKFNGKVGVELSATPINSLDIGGGFVSGSGYAGSVTAPTGGASILGHVTIGTTQDNGALTVQNSTTNTLIDMIGCQSCGPQAEWKLEASRAATSDSNAATLYSFTVPSFSSVLLEATITGHNGIDESEDGAWHFLWAVKNNAGTVSQIGATTETFGATVDANWNYYVDVSGTATRIRVRGGHDDGSVGWTANVQVHVGKE